MVKCLGTVVLVSALMAAQATAAYAQQGTPSGASQLDIDRWITHPVAIKLLPAQRVTFDSIRAAYKSAKDSVHKRYDGMGMQEQVMASARVDFKYMKIVRQILNPSQRRIFDKNTNTARRAEAPLLREWSPGERQTTIWRGSPD